MTRLMAKPRPSDPTRVRQAVTGLHGVLGGLPDHHDFPSYQAFETAFWGALDDLEAAFRAHCKDGRISRNDEYCTVAGFGRVATSRLGLIGALEKWLRAVERGLKED